MIAGHHRAGRQNHAIVKAFADDRGQRFFHRRITLTLVKLILIVIKQMADVMLPANVFNRLNTGVKIRHFMKQQRNAFLCKGRL
ncbi:Uncharacterised protein [Salmonella enterica subsp. enterica serovar Bovismorbificans]|nr:Uncharacterised protein [Salmonella enterica subsp. enterica serovar Bovismorbificans]CNT77308.1 Uncharacterised protein [Salmonella enterica subsp. enterica serovar Bovismorbificans]CNT88818.1 Uncharacterised protein [Salmonella enterica subsp. enterica serovar Bovismorbificans]CNU97076.1 Uncharacterised protein [Salmonella enterica subsp. enterica serovar Bovismorbificans]CNV03315.1 Uncharacterised protein [Salmonella enterica subsp. enterica serovar Bovismorbificans]